MKSTTQSSYKLSQIKSSKSTVITTCVVNKGYRITNYKIFQSSSMIERDNTEKKSQDSSITKNFSTNDVPSIKLPFIHQQQNQSPKMTIPMVSKKSSNSSLKSKTPISSNKAKNSFHQINLSALPDIQIPNEDINSFLHDQTFMKTRQQISSSTNKKLHSKAKISKNLAVASDENKVFNPENVNFPISNETKKAVFDDIHIPFPDHLKFSTFEEIDIPFCGEKESKGFEEIAILFPKEKSISRSSVLQETNVLDSPIFQERKISDQSNFQETKCSVLEFSSFSISDKMKNLAFADVEIPLSNKFKNAEDHFSIDLQKLEFKDIEISRNH